jgi:TRAP-type C4-dicarboxylate transport system substrate-binding protein
MNEFQSEQHQNLNDAAAEFRAKQRQLLEQQAKQKEDAIAPDGVAPLPQ